MTWLPRPPLVRAASVAGSFYPATAPAIEALVNAQLERARATSGVVPSESPLLGLLVPHAGLVYSGPVAAAGWRLLERFAGEPLTVVLLGTNHSAGWLDGAGIWESGSWRTPVGDVEVDERLAGAILDLGRPFLVDRAAHVDEHSIEVQLPFLRAVAPQARVVPISVATGVGDQAAEAGRKLGELIAERRGAGERIVLAASTDMAHYPAADVAAQVTQELLPRILALDPVGLARLEATFRGATVRGARTGGLLCGMCGIEPAVVGLAAWQAMGASAVPLVAATSADAGGSRDRTVGYLSAAFVAGGRSKDQAA